MNDEGYRVFLERMGQTAEEVVDTLRLIEAALYGVRPGEAFDQYADPLERAIRGRLGTAIVRMDRMLREVTEATQQPDPKAIPQVLRAAIFSAS